MGKLRLKLLIVFLLGFSGASAADLNRDKVAVIISGANLIDHAKKPPGLKEGSIELVKALVQSGKYNVTLLDREFYGSGINYNAIKNRLRKMTGDSGDLYAYEELSSSDQSSFGYSIDYYMSSDSPNAMFADIVRKEMDPDEEKLFMSRGRGITLDGLEDIILNLGAVALKDGFKTGQLSYAFNHAKNPVSCEITVGGDIYETEASSCFNNVEMEYRWIDQKARLCGHFDKEQDQLIKEVAALLCEPQHVQDFENYFQARIISPCETSGACLSGISGSSLQKLSDNFLAIMVESKVQNLREKAYADASFEYKAEFSQLLDEIAAFSLLCEKEGIDAMVLAKLTQDELPLYQARVQEINDALAKSFSDLLTSSELDLLRDNAAYYYKKCVLTKKEQSERNSTQGGFFEECEKQSLPKTLNEALDSLVTEEGSRGDEIKQFVRDSLSTHCKMSKAGAEKYSSYGYGRGRADSFDYRYDLKRCTDGMRDLTRNWQAYLNSDEGDLRNFSRAVSHLFPASRSTSILRSRTQDCLEALSPRYKDDEASIEKCREDALVSTRAQVFVESITLSRELGPVRRDASVLSDVFSLARRNDSIKKCLFEQASSREINKCVDVIRSEVVAKVPTGFFSGDSGSAAAALHDDLEIITKSLSREISVFHWASDELTKNNVEEPIPLSSWNTYQYAVGREYMFHVGPFLNSRVPSAGMTVAGRGLYAATDPNSTSDYGETLFEIRIPQESRFLDLREADGRGIPISRDTYEKMIAEGCDFKSHSISTQTEMTPRDALSRTGSSQAGFYATVDKTLFEQDGACHKIFSDAMSRLDVNFLAYSYGATNPSFCDEGASDRPAAFVMIDNRMRGNVRSYNRAQIDKALKDNEEKGTAIPGDITRLLQLNNGLYRTGDDSAREQTSSDAVAHWKSRLFNCDQMIVEDQVNSGLKR